MERCSSISLRSLALVESRLVRHYFHATDGFQKATVAPTPVTALLHAVAVVKSGAFAMYCDSLISAMERNSCGEARHSGWSWHAAMVTIISALPL